MRWWTALAFTAWASCSTGGSTVIRYPYPAPADTGHVQLALSPVARSAQVFIDDEHVGFVAGPTDVLVLHDVPIGFRHIVIRQAGSLQHARVEVVPRIVTHGKTTLAFAGPHPQPPSLSPPPVTPARRREPPELEPRPCGKLAFAIPSLYLLPLPGVRLCQPLGNHLSVELQASLLVTVGVITVGASADLWHRQTTPYLTSRGGVIASELWNGAQAYAGIGLRHRRIFFDIGGHYVRIYSDDNKTQKLPRWMPGFTFGID